MFRPVIIMFMVAVARGGACHCYIVVAIVASLDDWTNEDPVVSRMCGEDGHSKE
jgi:hypothetical protein